MRVFAKYSRVLVLIDMANCPLLSVQANATHSPVVMSMSAAAAIRPGRCRTFIGDASGIIV
jgi:hypothetical protein